MVRVLADTGDDRNVFVGIDWGGSHHQVCVVNADGVVLVQRPAAHTSIGLAEIGSLIGGFAASGQVVIAIERAEGLLVEFLLTLPAAVYCVSPKISSRARERYRMANTKSDAFDAFVLADTVRHEHRHWRPLSPVTAATSQIAALSRDRERIIVMQRAVESRLRATLEAYHPAPLHLFSALDRDIALAFIRDYPTPAAASRISQDRMRRFCARHGYSGRVDPAVLVERMRPHLLTGSAGTTAAKQISALMLVDQLELLNKQTRMFNHTLQPLVDAHPDGPIFTSFPGIATIIAATMIGEIGDDRTRFPSAAALLAEAGLAPVTRASGRTRQVRFRYAANKRLRHSIDWWMTVAAREDPWSTAIYEQARAAGQGRYRAYRGLGARWTRILWKAWTDHTTYDPSKAHHSIAA